MKQPTVQMQAYRPTLSVTPLRPLVSIAAGLFCLSVLLSQRSTEVPDLLTTAAMGALAAGVALGLDDEGFRLVRVVPTTALVRLGLRLAVLLPAVLVATGALLVTTGLLFDRPPEVPGATSLAALVAAAVAVEVWWSRHRPQFAAEGAAAVVLVWAMSPSLVPDVAVLRAGADAWDRHSPAVLAAAVAVALIGTRGRAA